MDSSWHKTLLPIAAAALCSAASFGGDLPDLNWTERSDWINVKTDVSPAAVGNGVADDTAAIQGALNTKGTGRTIYFPPGTYKITSMLLLGPRGDSNMGMNLVGHGRSTRLVWYGATGGNLIQINGNPYSRYEGLTLDGRGVASCGFFVSNSIRFETSIRLRHMAFRNFTGYGVWAVKETSPIAMAETSYENCIFDTCGRGIYLANFNDYNHTVAGCDFINCTYGLYATRGNFFVRDCYFTNSTICDIYLRPEHNCSVRRCKSVGSRKFIDSSSLVSPLTVMDCYVDQWKTSSAGGAISHGGAPPLVLSHCRFVRPLSTSVAPVTCTTGFLCANVAPSNTAVVTGSTLYSIAPGTNAPRVGGPGGAIVNTFVNTNVQVPSVVFDAKVNFGATGNGLDDDTAAVQNTINAARAAGNGAIAYFPRGDYRVTNTLDVSGANYVIGGCGYYSRIRWDGPSTGTTMRITDPDHLRLEHIMIGHHDLLARYPTLLCDKDVEQVSTTGAPSHMTYDGIELYGKYQSKPWRQGLFLNGLGTNCIVIVNAMSGNIRVFNSADATIIGNVTYEGAITVEDTVSARRGFLGIQTRLTTFNDFTMIIKNNNSIVMSDYYTEQGNSGILLLGSSNNPPGRVVIQNPKAGYATDPAMLVCATNYQGDVIFGACQFYSGTPNFAVNQTGAAPFRVHFFGNLFYNSKLQFNSQSGTLCALGNRVYSAGSAPANQNTNLVYPAITLALDDLMRLGILDIELNYPHVPLPERPFVVVTSGLHGTVTPPNKVGIWWGSSTSFVVRSDTYYHIGSLKTNGVAVTNATFMPAYTSRWSNVWYSGTLAAVFAENVTSNTGTPEWWLAQYGWTNDFSAAATNDSDQDGVPTWQEYLADTVPTNAASVLRVTGIGGSSGAVTIAWEGGTGAWQFVERRSDLTSTTEVWRAVFTNPPPTVSATNYTDTDFLLAPRFYRIRAQR